MAGANSEEEAWLNYTIQPFARQSFDVTSSAQLLAGLFMSKTFMKI
jgi:hypothetical protein